jgi:CheY-like chemotaxis protein
LSSDLIGKQTRKRLFPAKPLKAHLILLFLTANSPRCLHEFTIFKCRRNFRATPPRLLFTMTQWGTRDFRAMGLKIPQVLYVEDDQVNRLLMTEIFTQADDLRLMVAENGGEALDMAANNDIDLVITDIRMPGPDGYEILEALKSSPKTQSVPVIALSPAAMRSDLERGRQAGFAAYITKPMDIGAMIETVREYCALAAYQPSRQASVSKVPPVGSYSAATHLS